MFVLVLAVPALFVVVAGYVVGYAVTEWVYGLLGSPPDRGPEVAGWTTGLLLTVVVRLLVGRWRRRGEGGDHRDRHQK